MSKLNAEKRDNLDNNIFGLPSLRKYPLNDKTHVQKAIQLFSHCPVGKEKELAKNIYRASKKYNIEIDSKSSIYKYLKESWNYLDYDTNLELEDFLERR